MTALICLVGLTLLAGSASADKPLVDNLGWLAGSWTSNQTDGGQGEQTWLGPRDGAMFGVFRLHKDGKLQFSEHLVIAAGMQGVTLTIRRFDANSEPLPAAKGGLERFIVTRATATETVFEAMESRLSEITYRVTKNGMTVQVTPNLGPKAKPVRFDYTRAR